MGWSKLKYSKAEVEWASHCLVELPSDPKDLRRVIEIVDNFRAAHAFPLNTLQIRLRDISANIDDNAIIAQRLKRFYSIVKKLQNMKHLTLWRMQDIGGCRAIVKNITAVNAVVEAFKKSSIRHNLYNEDDYIAKPRLSGYRSRHLMYSYISDRSQDFNNLRIEVQIRTPLQHTWATAVETVDAFTKQALKSSMGDKNWTRFFQLMATVMALEEGTAPVPNTPNDPAKLKHELQCCAKELDVEKTFRGFAGALKITQKKSVKRGADFYLLSLNNINERLNITGFTRGDLEKAVETYSRMENMIRDKKATDAVLVSVSSVQNLRRAYPNYFADTFNFLEELQKAIA